MGPGRNAAGASRRATELALRELRPWLTARFGDRLSDLALFGSHARGEGREDSDVDVLVVVDDLSSSEATEIAHFCGDLAGTYDAVISPFALSSGRWRELHDRELLIAREIDRDRVSL